MMSVNRIKKKFKFLFQQRLAKQRTGTPSISLVVGGSQRMFSGIARTSSELRTWTIL